MLTKVAASGREANMLTGGLPDFGDLRVIGAGPHHVADAFAEQ
jgi:hypothetical protein